jgi:hypothetical protein
MISMFEHLFNSGVMKIDPGRKVGVFDLEVISKFPALRKAEMEKLRWMEGEWNAENSVRATRVSPAYVDTYPYTYRFCEDGTTLCIVRGGKEVPNITYDAFSKKWLLLMPGGGAFGMLTSAGWSGDSIEFTGHILMLGYECDLRTTLTRRSDRDYYMSNHERQPDGTWTLVDDWVFRKC